MIDRHLSAHLLAGLLLLLGLSACSNDSGDSPQTAANKTPVELPTYSSQALPEGLEWITNNDDPVFASPDAKKGGTYRQYLTSFPLTLRVVGPDSNSEFRDYVLNNQMSLVDVHPNTRNYIPVLATHWAYGEDNKTVYFKLNPAARWSDGTPVTADDYLFTLDFMRSEHIVAPWYNNYYSTDIVEVTKYDDYTISVTGGTAKPKEDLMLYYGISPTPRHFHAPLLNENWVRDTNWAVAPNTGAYQISRIDKGKYIEFTRKQDWWAQNLKYLQNRFNVDRIRLDVIRDPETAYRHFLRGELETFLMTIPTYWHERVNDPVFSNGYVERIWFYNDIPQPVSGMFLNMAAPLFQDQNVRYGFAHAMNIQRMLDTVLRGDYLRLHTYHAGYGDYTNDEIRAREFDLQKADEYFNRAGWDRRGPDGIRVKDGQRLSASVTYGTPVHTDRLVVLREEAKKAGVDLQLNLLDASAAYKNVMEKKHQVAWMAWGTSLRPAYWEHFHSANADNAQTNNITNTKNPGMDALIMRFNDSHDGSERARLAREIQQQVHEIGAFIPSYYVPYVRHAYWRWVKLPEWHGTRLSDDLFDEMAAGLFWIDEQAKEETLAAMRARTTFEPVVIVDETFKVE